MKTEKVTKEQYHKHLQAINKALRRNPGIREKIEQLRQARSRTEGREVSFNEMLGKILGVGVKLWIEEQARRN